MGFFGNKREAEPPARKDQVRRLLKLHMEETDESWRTDPDISVDERPFRKAKRALENEMNRSTKEEMRLAAEAARRHGY